MSPTPLEKWFLTMYLIANVKEGITASKIQKLVGVRDKTAWRMKHIIMEMIATKSPEIVIAENPAHLKKRIKNTHHFVSAQNLPLYLSEFQYRSKFWNSRKNLFFQILSMATDE